MKNPKVSIVTCTYNSETYLQKALDSIEKQTYRNIEHIFNDAYSTDKTNQIIKNYIKKNKDKYSITYMQSEPKGVANALNVAYPNATGDLIHFLHSDDYYSTNDSLERAVGYFEKDPELKWLTGDSIIEYKNKKYLFPVSRVLNISPKKTLRSASFLSHENTFMLTALLKKYGGFDETVISPVEYRLWLKMIRDFEPKIVHESFTVFIVHSGSTSTKNVFIFSRSVAECYKVLRKEKTIPVIGPLEDLLVYKEMKPIIQKAKIAANKVYNATTNKNH